MIEIGGEQMKILITGIGITGKSTLRKLLRNILSETAMDVKDFDADYQKIPNDFSENTIYLIEDVHGTKPDEAVFPLKSYDLILYVQPSLVSHVLFWAGRMMVWFKVGQFSWDKNYGWHGTNRSYDFRNIIPILKVFLRDFRNRKRWISNDLKELSSFRYVVIHSQWTFGRIEFIIRKKY